MINEPTKYERMMLQRLAKIKDVALSLPDDDVNISVYTLSEKTGYRVSVIYHLLSAKLYFVYGMRGKYVHLLTLRNL